MIQLDSDYLVLQAENGECFFCTPEGLSIEILGEWASGLEPELIQNAAEAVWHHFKKDKSREVVPVREFSEMLENALRGLGLIAPKAVEIDLLQVAAQAGVRFELGFFADLRAELKKNLAASPVQIRFIHLRESAKQLTGCRRWNQACGEMHAKILAFLRGAWDTDARASQALLIVQ